MTLSPRREVDSVEVTLASAGESQPLSIGMTTTIGGISIPGPSWATAMNVAGCTVAVPPKGELAPFGQCVDDGIYTFGAVELPSGRPLQVVPGTVRVGAGPANLSIVR